MRKNVNTEIQQLKERIAELEAELKRCYQDHQYIKREQDSFHWCQICGKAQPLPKPCSKKMPKIELRAASDNKTGFDKTFDKYMEDPEFAASYKAERDIIDRFDRVVMRIAKHLKRKK